MRRIQMQYNLGSVRQSSLVVTKPPKDKMVHTELGVTTQSLPEYFVRGFGPEIQRGLSGRTLALVPIELVGLEWRFDGKTDIAFTQSGVRQGLKVLVSTLPNHLKAESDLQKQLGILMWKGQILSGLN